MHAPDGDRVRDEKKYNCSIRKQRNKGRPKINTKAIIGAKAQDFPGGILGLACRATAYTLAMQGGQLERL